MLKAANCHAAAFACRYGRISMAGSDAHTLASLGRTFTTVVGVRTAAEFLDGLKQGRSTVAGESGDVWKLTAGDTLYWRVHGLREAWTIILAPLMALVPAITIMNFVMELSFAAKWGNRMAGGLRTPVSAEALLLR